MPDNNEDIRRTHNTLILYALYNYICVFCLVCMYAYVSTCVVCSYVHTCLKTIFQELTYILYLIYYGK